MYNDPKLFPALRLSAFKFHIEKWVKDCPSIKSITLHGSLNKDICEERYIIVWEVDGPVPSDGSAMRKLPGYDLYEKLSSDFQNDSIDKNTYLSELEKLLNRFKPLKKAIEEYNGSTLRKLPGYGSYKKLLSDFKNESIDLGTYLSEIEKLLNQFKVLKEGLKEYYNFNSLNFKFKAHLKNIYSGECLFDPDFIDDVYDIEANKNADSLYDWTILLRKKGENFPDGISTKNFIQLYPDTYLKGDPYKEKNDFAKKLLKYEIKKVLPDIENFYDVLSDKCKMKYGYSLIGAPFNEIEACALELLEILEKSSQSHPVKREYLIKRPISNSVLNFRGDGHERGDFIEGILYQHVPNLGFFIPKKKILEAYKQIKNKEKTREK